MDLLTRLWGRYHVPQNVFLVSEENVCWWLAEVFMINQQHCESTEWNSHHWPWPASGLLSFFLHHPPDCGGKRCVRVCVCVLCQLSVRPSVPLIWPATDVDDWVTYYIQVCSLLLQFLPSVRPSVCLSVCPSVRLSVRPSVRLSVLWGTLWAWLWWRTPPVDVTVETCSTLTVSI